MRRALPSGIVLVVLAAGLAGCGGTATEPAPGDGPSRVVIKVPGMT